MLCAVAGWARIGQAIALAAETLRFRAIPRLAGGYLVPPYPDQVTEPLLGDGAAPVGGARDAVERGQAVYPTGPQGRRAGWR